MCGMSKLIKDNFQLSPLKQLRLTQLLGIVLIQIILQLSEISSPTQSTIPSQEHFKRMRRGFNRRVSISSLITCQYLHIRIFFLQIQDNVEMGILGLCVWKMWSQSTIFRVKLMLTNVEYNIIWGYLALTYPIFDVLVPLSNPPTLFIRPFPALAIIWTTRKFFWLLGSKI